MPDYTTNHKRIELWRQMRQRVQHAKTEKVLLDYLRSFGDSIRPFMPGVATATTVSRDDIARALEVAIVHGTIIGSWLNIDPINPEWPGRDRLFVFRRDDLITTCSVLAALGFFSTNCIAEIIDHVETSGSKAFVPGIEAPGTPPDSIPELLWESAVSSAKSKKKWRTANLNQTKWADEYWAASPAVWRSCALLDTADPVTEKCRLLPKQHNDITAGLVAFIKVPRSDANDIVDAWQATGWNTFIVNRSDCLGLYQLLTETRLAQPTAIMIAVGDSMSPRRNISKTIVRRRESGLLGEMSDEQFSTIIGDSL